MKVGVYSPYLDTVGGGEKYMLTIAESLSKENSVDILLDKHLQNLEIKQILGKTSNLLNVNLEKVNFENAPFGKGTNIWERLKFLKKYDLFFYLTDGSIFYSSARLNILHIQSPIRVSNRSVWKKIKSSSWDLIIYNSQFTKSNCEKFWNIKSEILYPPISTEIFKPAKKKNQILTVGRFYGYLKDKKHALMIDVFKKMYDTKKLKDWEFHLAGGSGEGDADYINELEKLSEGYPIKIHPNMPFENLKTLYGESSIYWHASGFGESDPTKMEHFGITTVESMASGCVPVVINKGGQTEIVENNKSGYLWDTPDDLIQKTEKLINDKTLWRKLSESAIERSKEFSKEKFISKLNEIIKKHETS